MFVWRSLKYQSFWLHSLFNRIHTTHGLDVNNRHLTSLELKVKPDISHICWHGFRHFSHNYDFDVKTGICLYMYNYDFGANTIYHILWSWRQNGHLLIYDLDVKTDVSHMILTSKEIYHIWPCRQNRCLIMILTSKRISHVCCWRPNKTSHVWSWRQNKRLTYNLDVKTNISHMILCQKRYLTYDLDVNTDISYIILTSKQIYHMCSWRQNRYLIYDLNAQTRHLTWHLDVISHIRSWRKADIKSWRPIMSSVKDDLNLNSYQFSNCNYWCRQKLMRILFSLFEIFQK